MQQVDELERVQLTPMQREQMAALLKQLDTTRIVAENFVSYFAKELGVSLSLYQFDSAGLCFAPIMAAGRGPWAAGAEVAEGLPEAVAATVNGHAEI